MLAEAATPLERDEELRTIADRLRLSEESVRYLLNTAGARAAGGRGGAPSGRATAAPAARALGGAHEVEVRFLAGCLALADKGRECLDGIDEAYFASAETRAACRWVRARLAPKGAGENEPSGESSRPEDGAEEMVAELVLRAGREHFTATVVDELFLRLQEAQVGRLIARLKVAAGTDETGEREAKLAELEAVRRRLREAIRSIPVTEGSMEGQGRRT